MSALGAPPPPLAACAAFCQSWSKVQQARALPLAPLPTQHRGPPLLYQGLLPLHPGPPTLHQEVPLPLPLLLTLMLLLLRLLAAAL